MSDIVVGAFFTRNSGVPATGLALADIELYLTRQDKQTGVDSVVWNGTQNPTEEIDNIGAYTRIYASGDLDTYIYYARATYTGAVVLDIDHVTGSIPQSDPWAFETRTLSSAAASTVAAVAGSVVTQPWATTWNFSITGLGNLSARTALYFTVKRRTTDIDSAAVVQIEETAGLEIINAAAATVAGNGTLTVDDAVAGDVTVTLAAVESNELRPVDGLYYDFKMVTATAVQLLTMNRFNISDVVTGAIA
ncbi:MAG: hypothetical protein GWN93_11700 [Deltaproteobacteria bacterium]|nr:hypothetical protein [Deltaproteobacteria bacterium]